MARPHIEPFCDRDVDFKNMNLPGFGNGMRYKMLSFDVDTGACTMTVQFDGGYSQTPGFSWSEMELCVIEGSIRFGDKVMRHVIPRTVRLSEAPSFGQPISTFDPLSRGAIAYRDLAKEILGDTDEA